MFHKAKHIKQQRITALRISQNPILNGPSSHYTAYLAYLKCPILLEIGQVPKRKSPAVAPNPAMALQQLGHRSEGADQLLLVALAAVAQHLGRPWGNFFWESNSEKKTQIIGKLGKLGNMF